MPVYSQTPGQHITGKLLQRAARSHALQGFVSHMRNRVAPVAPKIPAHCLSSAPGGRGRKRRQVRGGKGTVSAQVVWPLVSLVREGLVNGRLEAPHVLHREVVWVTGLEVLVEDCKDLRVEHLEPSDAVNHSLQLLGERKV